MTCDLNPLSVVSGPIGTAVKSAKNYTYVFSTWYRTNKEARELINHLSVSGKKKIILFFGNDPFWQDFSNDLKQGSKNTDIELVNSIYNPLWIVLIREGFSVRKNAFLHEIYKLEPIVMYKYSLKDGHIFLLIFMGKR